MNVQIWKTKYSEDENHSLIKSDSMLPQKHSKNLEMTFCL